MMMQTIKVLVLYDHIFESAGTSPDICEEVPYIAGFPAEGLARAAEAVTNELVVVRRTSHVSTLGALEKKRLYGLGMERREIFVRQLQFYCKILIIKLLTL